MSICLHACTQPLSPLTNSFDVLWYESCPWAHESLMCCIKSLVLWICVLYNVHTFLHQSPNSSRLGFQVNRRVWQTQIWRDKIQCFLMKELDCFTRTKWRQKLRMHHLRRRYLKANKVSKNEETRKVEYAYQCADALVETKAWQSWRIFWDTLYIKQVSDWMSVNISSFNVSSIILKWTPAVWMGICASGCLHVFMQINEVCVDNGFIQLHNVYKDSGWAICPPPLWDLVW